MTVLVATAAYFANAGQQSRQKQMVIDLLRIATAPSSLQIDECEDWGFTDIQVTCVFDIDPADFTVLLKGWPLVEAPARASSHSFATGPKIGSPFPVNAEFSIVDPAEFDYGGRISLVSNASRSRVQLDYYEE